jgi:predicted DNA-binding transcriptional regulator YafY
MEQLFNQRTDENHALTGNQLIDILGAMGIKAERKTIYDDIATLCDAGIDIRTTKSGHSNAYYLGERLFNDEELKIIADAVASSKYLTIKRSNELIKKLQTMTSDFKSPALKRSITVENRTKASNDSVYATVDKLQEAILSDREVQFTYSEYTFAEDGASGDRKKQGRHDVKRIVSPYQLVWDGDCYRLICRCAGLDKVCSYRIDRISEISVLQSERRSLSEDEEQELRRLKSGVHSEGETVEMRISFDNSLIEEVMTRFGEKIYVRRESPATFYADITTELSDDFLGWLFKLGGKAKILSPEYAADAVKDRLAQIGRLYE